MGVQVCSCNGNHTATCARVQFPPRFPCDCGVAAGCEVHGVGGIVEKMKRGESPDMVNHPPHYRRGGLEAIDVIEAFELGFNLGNAVKYILRAGHKGDRLEDLRKALWYLKREVGDK